MGRLKFPTQVTLGESGKSSYSSSCEKLLQLLLPQVGGYYSVHPELAWSWKLVLATLMLSTEHMHRCLCTRTKTMKIKRLEYVAAENSFNAKYFRLHSRCNQFSCSTLGWLVLHAYPGILKYTNHVSTLFVEINIQLLLYHNHKGVLMKIRPN